MKLSVYDHDRGVLGMRYLYLVRSRRAKGLSLGINLSPNRACNWRCLYCQVPNLARGTSPHCDIERLCSELARVQCTVPVDALVDMAFSGDGEPTSAPNFDAALQAVLNWRAQHAPQTIVRLITNGSYLLKPSVQHALSLIGAAKGEVWCKVDAVGKEASHRIHGVRLSPAMQAQWLAACARHCRTFVQTCVFLLDGRPSYEKGLNAYLELLAEQKKAIAGVLLYGVARKVQVAPERVRAAPVAVLQRLAERIRALGIACEVHA